MTPPNTPLLLGILLVLLVPNCKSTERKSASNRGISSATTTSSLAPPVDHLAEGELQASAALAFGFPVPTSMRLERAFANAVHLEGDVPVEGLIRYVQANAQTRGLELQGKVMVFDSVRIKSADQSRLFRFQITRKGRSTQLLIQDKTPATLPPEPTLTDEERWRRAGLKPDGSPLDVSQLR